MQLRDHAEFIAVFGACEMQLDKLPTIIDFAKHYLRLRVDEDHGYLYPDDDIPTKHESLYGSLFVVWDIWRTAMIPIEHVNKTVHRIENYLLHLYALVNEFKSETFNSRLSTHLANFNVLLDIAGCKCKDLSSCNCKSKYKIPEVQHSFINDQRKNRELCIECRYDTRNRRKIDPYAQENRFVNIKLSYTDLYIIL